jgi:hypothetical protein
MGRRRRMSDLISLRRGARPWAPAFANDEAAEVLDYYDMPLAGILRQHGAYFLFQCLEGQLDTTNLWAYVLLEPWEVEQLRSADEDQLDDAIERTFYKSRRDITVAIATEELGIVLSVVVTAYDDTRQTLIRSALDKFKRVIDEEVRAVKAVGSVTNLRGTA